MSRSDSDTPAGRRDCAALAAYHRTKVAELMERELSELQLGDLLWTQETDDGRDHLQRDSD